MNDDKVFIDTNVLLYLLSNDTKKADQAESIIQSGPLISIQVLNEIVNALRRKMHMSWADISEFTHLIRSLCPVKPLTNNTHEQGMLIAQKHMLSFHASMIVSAALLCGCNILYSEDMQHGLLIDNKLLIRDPFEPGLG